MAAKPLNPSLPDERLLEVNPFAAASTSKIWNAPPLARMNRTMKWRMFSASNSQQQQQQQHTATYIDEFEDRRSADEVRKEILKCYELICKLGRGAVYLGSARTKPDQAHFLQAMELGREVALLLDCTSWTGAGPGLMDAAMKGALEVGKPVAGLRIHNEAGVWTDSNVTHSWMLPETYLTCKFFSARKHGLVDAGVRSRPSDHTAFVALPGGIGTLDEIFEILTLLQLGRIGSTYPVPFLLMNYDDFYTHLLSFFETCRKWGTISKGEVEKFCKVCNSNVEALEYLSDFYSIEDSRRKFRGRLKEETEAV